MAVLIVSALAVALSLSGFVVAATAGFYLNREEDNASGCAVVAVALFAMSNAAWIAVVLMRGAA